VGKPTAKETWAGVVMAALAILSSYLGYDKYEQIQAAKSEPGNQSVEVNIASVPDSLASHTHGPVLSRVEVERMIEKAVRDRHAKDLEVFKQLESWEKK